MKSLLISALVMLASVACSTSKPDAMVADASEPVPDVDACTPLAVEVCGDAIDNTCDGLIDENCPEPGRHLWAKDLGGPVDQDVASAQYNHSETTQLRVHGGNLRRRSPGCR